MLLWLTLSFIFLCRNMLIDNHGRKIDYLRLAITDRCNLRCHYCMPAEGMHFLPRKDLLTYEEMIRLTQIMSKEGITKVRLTGGEPFVRRDFPEFLKELSRIEGLEQVSLTTNGTMTRPHIPMMKEIGIHAVNLSLDSLDREQFADITRRDEFPEVMACLHDLIEAGIKTKINAVVMSAVNTDAILPMVALSEKLPIDVRFIEEMPFNGGQQKTEKIWSHRDILTHIEQSYPHIEALPFSAGATSNNYKIQGHMGTIGIIAAYSRTFCGTCNRLRVTSNGQLKTCLYDKGVFSLRDLLRQYPYDDTAVVEAIRKAVGQRPVDGFEAEQGRNAKTSMESMSTIGG